MPLDPKAEEVQSWLQKASKDLAAGKHALNADPPLTEDAVFHAQQVAEKAIKAFLVWHEVRFKKIHDIRELGAAAIKIDFSWKALLEDAAELSPYATIFRYPGESGEPLIDDAIDALNLSEKVYHAVIERLPKQIIQ